MPETNALRPVTRPRLYEQVAQQVPDIIEARGALESKLAATAAMSDHVERVSDVALLRD